MEFELRPYNRDNKAERLACLQIYDSVWPEQMMSLEEWDYWDSVISEAHYYQHYVAYADDQLVAMGWCSQAHWTQDAGKYQVNLFVPAGYRHNGIGTALLNRFIAETTPLGLTKLGAWTREHQAEGIRFLQNRGFVQVARGPISELDSARFDSSQFQASLDKAMSNGIEIKSLAELEQSEPNWKQKLYEAHWEMLQDVPSTEPFRRFSFEEWHRRILERPTFLAEGWFVALDSDKWIGLSQLRRRLGTNLHLNTGLTGVARSHRRKGIATALKVKGIEFAKAYGPAIISTNNEENNPMFQLNLRLGFEPRPAGLDFARTIQNPQSKIQNQEIR